MTDTKLIHVCNAFQHLATIDLRIGTQNSQSEWKWPKLLSSGNVILVLNFARVICIWIWDSVYLAPRFKILNSELDYEVLEWPISEHECSGFD